jgi:enoyl-CoA hydratase
MFNPQGALVAGFLDRVVAVDQLMPTALEVAQELKKLNMNAHKHTKRKARKGLLDTMDQAIQSDQSVSVTSQA